MGVPRLFPFTINTFRKSVKHFASGKYSTTVDYLLLDANCLLHGACQEVYKYGSNTSLIDRYEHLSDDEKFVAVCEMFIRQIKDIVNMVTPTKLLQITLDGTAPLAKQAQQRQRRYVAARTRANHSFDSNSITPGTRFMYEVTKFLNYAIRREINNGSWRGFDVYFSPCTVSGEGEHKNLSLIRSLTPKQRNESRFCLFGPDGDLIMLALAAHVPRILLFRDDQYNLGHHHLLDMGSMYQSIGRIFGKTATTRSRRDMVNDFIFLGFFVGNDFLPKVQMFHLLEEGLEFMLATQSKLTIYPTKNGHIDVEGLKAFVNAVAKSENEFITAQKSFKPPSSIFRNNTLMKNISNGALNWGSFRRDYYAKAGATTEDAIGKMCLDYLKTIEWVFEYYVHGLRAWRWVYPWHYAPLITDVSNYLNKQSYKPMSFNLQEPSRPFVQLLSVLPPTSASLLPLPYRSVLLKGGSAYPDPQSFEIDYEGKFKEYQGVAKLPFVDYDSIYGEYIKLHKTVTKPYVRNEFSHDAVFKYDKDYTAIFESPYGTIDKLHVRKMNVS